MKAIQIRTAMPAMLLAGALTLTAAGAWAQQRDAYPSRSVRVVVPLAPGGATDIQARNFAHRLSERLGQSFVVDNRAGAGGTIAYAHVAKTPADGYTLLAVPSDFTMTPWMYANLSYDAAKDFAPISLVTEAPFLLLVHPSVQANSVKELLAAARARPGSLNFASGGQGSSLHVALELFKSLAKVNLVHVPYKGGGPALLAAVAGEVNGTFGNIVSAIPHVRAGKLRALATTATVRSSTLPDVPTVVDAGVTGYVTTAWHGWLAPAGTPQVVVQQLSGELAKVVQLPEVARQITAEGGRPIGSTPDEFRQLMAQEFARWRKVIQDANIRVE